MKPGRKKRSKHGKGEGKDWKKRGTKQKVGLKAKQLKADMRIIEKTPELSQFYMQRYIEITKSWQKGIKRQMMAVKMTKEYAKQNNIAWRL